MEAFLVLGISNGSDESPSSTSKPVERLSPASNSSRRLLYGELLNKLVIQLFLSQERWHRYENYLTSIPFSTIKIKKPFLF
jgi:hypothetical protein